MLALLELPEDSFWELEHREWKDMPVIELPGDPEAESTVWLPGLKPQLPVIELLDEGCPPCSQAWQPRDIPVLELPEEEAELLHSGASCWPNTAPPLADLPLIELPADDGSDREMVALELPDMDTTSNSWQLPQEEPHADEQLSGPARAAADMQESDKRAASSIRVARAAPEPVPWQLPQLRPTQQPRAPDPVARETGLGAAGATPSSSTSAPTSRVATLSTSTASGANARAGYQRPASGHDEAMLRLLAEAFRGMMLKAAHADAPAGMTPEQLDAWLHRLWDFCNSSDRDRGAATVTALHAAVRQEYSWVRLGDIYSALVYLRDKYASGIAA